MATRSRTVVAITAFALLALTGCQPDGPTVVPDPTPTVPPIFESDEEALAAAEEAYGKYLAVSDQIFIDGGRGGERIDEVAAEEHAKLQRDAFAKMLEEGRSGTGKSTFDSMELQQFDQSSEDGQSIISVYACLDISETDSLDADGESIVAEGRRNRLPVEIYFDSKPDERATLLIASLEIWSGDDFCD